MAGCKREVSITWSLFFFVNDKTFSPVIDLQLPQQETYFEPPVEYEPEPVVKEFKEKTVESLKDDETQGESSFKKRKLNTGAKRNVRQRLDDD